MTCFNIGFEISSVLASMLSIIFNGHRVNVSFTLLLCVCYSSAALRQLQTEVYDHSKRWLNALPIFTRVSR